MVEESMRLNRLAQARQDLAEISVHISALAAQIPEPVASVAEALKSLTPEQHEALRVRRTEALDVIAQQRITNHNDDVGRCRMALQELQTLYEELQAASNPVNSSATAH